jgi:hypothetical protein
MQRRHVPGPVVAERSRVGFIASYGEMSRRSGVAAEEDNHSDISPFIINNLRLASIAIDTSSNRAAITWRACPA